MQFPDFIQKIKSPFIQKPPYTPKIDELALVKAQSTQESIWNTLGRSWYDFDKIKIQNEIYGDINETDAIRRAISSISNYWNALGIYRQDFDKAECDRLAQNAYYSIAEKAIIDYISTLEWGVKDKDGNPIESAEEFIAYPNPQDEFQVLLKAMLRDLIRYDAGTWIKSFNKKGELVEMKAYLGTEFWKMIDKPMFDLPQPRWDQGVYYNNYISHGYTRLFWQRSRPGIYVPFQPEEVCYFCMYPKSDDVYGRSFIQDLKYQIQYLIDSTRAAGKTFENGVVPSLIWNHPDVMDRNTLYERIQQVDAANKGTYKFGSMLHTVSNEKVETLSHKLIDMQWLEGQRFVAQLIWGMWGFPASEFIESQTNRATAYVQRNVTKSKTLYPILSYIERKINREVLRYLPGYQPDWKFAFLKDVDLEDHQRIAQINSIKVNTFSQLVQTGVPRETALKLSSIGDTLSEEEIANLDGGENIGQTSETKENGTPESLHEGRYSDPNYVPMDNQTGNTGKTRSNEIDDSDEAYDANPTTTRKAKRYVKDPSQAPVGIEVKLGERGGMFYEY